MADQGVSERIKSFNQGLLADKVQIKYRLMSMEPFRFFRGTCHLFFEDLDHSDIIRDSPVSWMSGDLHVENFGSFKGDNRLVYFDLNDFDEGVLGPASWEILRLVSSIFVAFDTLGIEDKKAMKWARLYLKTYRETLVKGKSRYLEIETSRGMVKTFLERVSQRKLKALLEKHLNKAAKKPELEIENIKHFRIEKGLKKDIIAYMDSWIRKADTAFEKFDVVDACFRVAGTGSLGLKRYLFLVQSTHNKKDYFILDMKEARPSSLQPFIKHTQPAWQSEAERVITIKEMLQNVSPALLGTADFMGNSFVLQEMQPMEDKINFKMIRDRYKDVNEVIEDMALLTASAQLRSSGRKGSAIADELIEFGSRQGWQEDVLEYGANYLHKVKADYQQFVADYERGFFK